MNPAAVNIAVNFKEEKAKIKDFIEKYREFDELKYKEIIDSNPKHLEIELDDVYSQDPGLCRAIENNTRRYTNLFCQVVDEMIPMFERAPDDDASPLDVLIYQRIKRNEQLNDEQGDIKKMFPPSLIRRYCLNFKGRSLVKNVSVREIRGSSVGKFLKVKGMITKVSNVKPFCVVAAYSCDQCGNEIFQDVASQSWAPLDVCPSDQCKTNNIKGSLFLQTRGCKFLKFQEVKLQELTDQVPMGHIPRSMTVYLIEEQTRKVNPGEIVTISGALLPIPFSGFKALKAGLITDTYLEAHHIDQMKKQYADMNLTDEITQRINEIVSQPGVYDRLAHSLAPEIYGHDDVKKALLLMLVGGTNKETADGMKVRGDINICLMGDPGVAKSQLLKHISKIAPRAVYTTGRGSSGVGLTASVTRDTVTDEMVLEGGALVLADNGVACIDEFDKMDETDRTAIHEVMEQQTISIAKAGINTTLNARCSILAAANPQFGRYNVRAKPTDNINLPAALLSRFDLLFLLLDKPSIEADLRLAQHVTYVHRTLHHPKEEDALEPLEENLMKNYISIARTFQPLVPREVGDYVTNVYVHLRQRADETADFQYTCARTLLSIIRLASALARLRFASEIQRSDVDEAVRLIEASKASLFSDGEKKKKDPISSIFNIIKDLSTKGNGAMEKEIKLGDVRESIINKGYTEDQLQRCLTLYEEDDVWMKTGADGNTLRWVSIEDSDEDL